MTAPALIARPTVRAAPHRSAADRFFPQPLASLATLPLRRELSQDSFSDKTPLEPLMLERAGNVQEVAVVEILRATPWFRRTRAHPGPGLF